MELSIIIPALNEEGFIEHLLSDLQKQDGLQFETIVVDGGSTDATVKLAKSFPVRLLSTRAHIARQRNLGAQHASSPILLFLDADVRLKTDDLAKLYHKFIKQKTDIACPYFLPYASNIAVQAVYLFFDLMFFLFQKISQSGAGSALMVKKSVFEKLGGFPEDTRYDDIAFIRKAAGAYKYALLPHIVHVSDRRFRRDGVLRTTLIYFFLSFFFIIGQFKRAEMIPYTFGHYQRSKRKNL